MPVPPAEPFNPQRYVVEGDSTSIKAAHTAWVDYASQLYQLIGQVGPSMAVADFEGPEALLWRDNGTQNLEKIGGLARSIQLAGEALGDWAVSIDAAVVKMVPVQAAATVAHGELVAAVGRVVAAESVAVTAAVNLIVAQTELAIAAATTALTSGAASPAIAAAQAHVTQAVAEMTRAAAEVSAAFGNHTAADLNWRRTNAEADGIQDELAIHAGRASSVIKAASQPQTPARNKRQTSVPVMNWGNVTNPNPSAVTRAGNVLSGVQSVYNRGSGAANALSSAVTTAGNVPGPQGGNPSGSVPWPGGMPDNTPDPSRNNVNAPTPDPGGAPANQNHHTTDQNSTAGAGTPTSTPGTRNPGGRPDPRGVRSDENADADQRV